jgi:hypothetical protein
MGLSAEEILEHIRELPPSEQRRLVARVVREVGEPPSSGEEAEMDRELERRIERAEAGTSTPAREVLAMLRARA